MHKFNGKKLILWIIEKKFHILESSSKSLICKSQAYVSINIYSNQKSQDVNHKDKNKKFINSDQILLQIIKKQIQEL